MTYRTYLGVEVLSAVSDIIRLVRIQARIYHNAKICGNWFISEHELGQTCFHVVTQGKCRLEVPGVLDTIIETGDLILFPREIEHSMSPVTPQNGPQKHLDYLSNDVPEIEGTGLLCAEVSFQHQASQELLRVLPSVTVLRKKDNSVWLAPLLDLTLRESYGSSSIKSVVLDRLCELLFIYSITSQLKNLPEGSTGPLALHACDRLRGGLDAIHQSPAKHWSLNELAVASAMSRSLFASTFRKVSAWTPMQYLTWWRMQLAWEQLEAGLSVVEVADKVGYKSQAGFSRAFYSCFKVNAGKVRRAGALIT